MSGVVALLGYDSVRSNELVPKMCQILKHRGIDDSGWFADSKVAIANVATYKGSKIAHQPLCNKKKNIWITLDGTLYNNCELKEQFDKDPSTICSDAELILKAYETNGIDCLKQLDGVFAFCIWDSTQEKLFAARDRFGSKPLFYTVNGDCYVLASEIKAIFVDPAIPRKPNHDLLCRYLIQRYHFRNGDTYFAQIKEVLPGYYAVFTLDENKPEVAEYWHLPSPPASKQGKYNYPSLFLDKLHHTTKKMIPKEVQFGTCTSGGIDSQAIASLISNELAKTNQVEKQTLVSAICAGGSRGVNEQPYIREYERFRGTAVKYVNLPQSLRLKELERLVFCLEEPYHLESAYLSFCLANELHNEKAKVAFLGTGMDTYVTGDFEIYDALRILWQKRKIGKFLVETIGMIVHQDLSYITFGKIANQLKLLRTPRPARQETQFLNQEYIAQARITENFARTEESQVDRTIGSITEILQAQDKIFSAFSIEPRYPSLDPEFALFCMSLPESQRSKRGVSKYVLREAVKGLIPEAVRKSKRKFGSSVPAIKWVKSLRPEILEILSSDKFKARGIFNQSKLLKTFDMLCSGSIDPAIEYDVSQFFWMVLTLELWFQIYIDPEKPSFGLKDSSAVNEFEWFIADPREEVAPSKASSKKMNR
ncbi:MAG: asparagine synthetase B family protein [Candidatus Bathyarchaeia archaeon]